MYYQSAAPENDERDECSSGIFWCGKTQDSFGPDGKPVGKMECCAERPCYVS